jgi:hypothetical protein
MLFVNFNIAPAFSTIYYDNSENTNNPNVDKFVPQSGVKVKNSTPAQWLENTTRKFMEANNIDTMSDLKENNNTNNETQTNRSTVYKKTYKWF